MNPSFSFRESCKSFVEKFNQQEGKRNICKLSMDVSIDEPFEGNFLKCEHILNELCQYLNTILVNGLITIEVIKESEVNESIGLKVAVYGRDHGTSLNNQNRSLKKHASQAHTLANNLPQEIQCEVSDDQIKFSSKKIFRLSKLGKEASSLPFFNKNVLIAEDNEINAMVFSSFLEEWGCKVTHALNGEEALTLAHEQPFDLILMDIHMPVMKGDIATAKIREFNTHIPIIALTASTLEEDIKSASQAGISDYLLKPVSSHLLRNVMSKYMV